MFEIFSAVGGVLTFAADHRFAVLALACAAGGFAAQTYIPVAGATIAKGCFAAAIGLGCFDGGYSLRARQDRSAELRAQVNALQEDIRSANLVAENAKARSETAERRRDADQRKVEDYAKMLAKRGDCPLSRDDARRLRDLGR